MLVAVLVVAVAVAEVVPVAVAGWSWGRLLRLSLLPRLVLPVPVVLTAGRYGAAGAYCCCSTLSCGAFPRIPCRG